VVLVPPEALVTYHHIDRDYARIVPRQRHGRERTDAHVTTHHESSKLHKFGDGPSVPTNVTGGPLTARSTPLPSSRPRDSGDPETVVGGRRRPEHIDRGNSAHGQAAEVTVTASTPKR
jgi:hypothetical protein